MRRSHEVEFFEMHDVMQAVIPPEKHRTEQRKFDKYIDKLRYACPQVFFLFRILAL